MINDYIIWRKVYGVNHSSGKFKILISSHTDKMFYGMVIYYTRSGTMDTGIHLELRHQNFVERTEKEVYDGCVAWMKDNLPGQFEITLVSADH